MTVTVHMPPEGVLDFDPRIAVTMLTVSEQKRLFKRVGQYITDEDCQRVMDDLADAVTESRDRAAKDILAGKWPVIKPIPVDALKRFCDAQLPIVLSGCKKPDILTQYEK